MTSLAIRSSIRITVVSVAAATLLAGAAGIAGAETAPTGAPKASDIATLRQLLALQYPALRYASTSREETTPPSESSEPDRADAKLEESDGGA